MASHKGRRKVSPDDRPPRRCSNADCRQLRPCKIHPEGWSREPKVPLPSNWAALRRQVKEQSGLRCKKCGHYDSTGQVDHIINRARGGSSTLDNLQWLCQPCHKHKSNIEKNWSRRKKKE